MKTAVGFRQWRQQVLQQQQNAGSWKQKNGDDVVSVGDGTTTVVTGDGATIDSDLHRPGAVPVGRVDQHEHCSGDNDVTSTSTAHLHEDHDHLTEQGMVGSAAAADVANTTIQSMTAVEAYPVEEDNTQLVKATVVRNRNRNLLIASTIVLILLAIGLGVGLTQGGVEIVIVVG